MLDKFERQGPFHIKLYLSGNLLISLLAALVILIIPLYEIIPNPNTNSENTFYIICGYAIFAFITTFIREVIKDFEDASGDKKMVERGGTANNLTDE